MAAIAGRLDFEQIREMLPQRFPLIMLDRVTQLEAGARIVALKNITGNELHFLGHFPSLAVMPGVLIIEAAAQAAGILWAASATDDEHASTWRHHLASTNISFHRPVTPGDQMVIEACILRRLGAFFVVQVKITVDSTIVAKGQLTLARTSHGAEPECCTQST